MIRLTNVILVSLLVVGCNSPVPRAQTLKEKLVGLSIDELKSEPGQPDSERQMSGLPHFGPYPSSLKPGDVCTYLYYADYNGEQVHVFCVAPQLYGKIKGASPGGKKSYVLDVFTFPQGTVF